jgi:hypothetical protein
MGSGSQREKEGKNGIVKNKNKRNFKYYQNYEDNLDE